METSIWKSFSSTTSRALSYVPGIFHFPIPALQLTLVLSGKQIQMLLREQGVKQPVQPHIFGKISAPKQGSGTYCLSEGRIAFPHPACTLGQSCHPLISQQPVALLCFQHFSRFAGRQGAGRPMSACALNESFQQGWACVAQAQRHTLPWGQQLKRHHGLLQETCISFCNQSSFFFFTTFSLSWRNQSVSPCPLPPPG